MTAQARRIHMIGRANLVPKVHRALETCGTMEFAHCLDFGGYQAERRTHSGSVFSLQPVLELQMMNFSESTSTRRPMINQQILRAKITKRLVSNHGDLLKHALVARAVACAQRADQVSSGPDKRGVRFARKGP